MTGEKLRDRVIIENTTLKKAIQQFREKLPQIQKDNYIKVDLEIAIKLREDSINKLLQKKIKRTNFTIKNLLKN